MKATVKRKRRKSDRAKRAFPSSRRAHLSQGSIAWIRDLASPYLKGYESVAVRESGLEGYWFVADGGARSERKTANHLSRRSTNQEQGVGFFVGYLAGATPKYSFLYPKPPECLIFAWISPADRPPHERLVKQPGSLVRKTFDYIRWLTHRPPRFVFHEAEAAAMARHASMEDWPPEKRKHLSRNFFIETLAWLVRSGLVRKLREEAAVNRVQPRDGDAP